MIATQALAFEEPGLAGRIESLSEVELDTLNFGVIGFDSSCVVRCYNKHESKASGLSPQRVLGHALFDEVAICMNNFMIAQRFKDAAADGSELDATIDYVLTLRMRPVKVRLRLLAVPQATYRYVLIERQI
jgi:photoactive yellow protein